MTSDSSSPVPNASSPAPKKSSAWMIALPIAGAVLALVLYLTCGGRRQVEQRGVRAVPIVAAKAVKSDMPTVFSALGTVTPTDVVTIRTRVNGQLMRVAFTEGQMVNEGDLLAEIDPRPYEVQLTQAEGQMSKNLASYLIAAADLERYKNLVEQGIISQQQVDSQAAKTDELAASLKSDEGTIASAKLNLTYCRITAPVSGRVGLRQVDPGNLVSTTDPNGIVVITPLAPIHVSFSIPADSVGRVINKDYKRLSVDAWDRDSTRRLAVGILWAIDNQVDSSTGTVKLKALFPNTDLSLFPNQFVNVRLHVDTLRGVVTVPSSAIQKSPQGNYVYTVKDDSTVEMRLVEVLASQGDKTALKAGLAVGEVVATDGIERLRPGATVTIPGGMAEGQTPEQSAGAVG